MLSLLQRHLPFPTPCLSIIFVEFQERYAYYAFRAILSTYFLTLGMSEHSATSLFLFTSALGEEMREKRDERRERRWSDRQ